MKVRNRYELSQTLIKSYVPFIASIPLPETQSAPRPGHHFSGQDPNQFGRITREDFVIDGGTLGQGSAINHRVERFLANPESDREWLSRLTQSWQNKRPGFLLLNSAHGSSASITAISPTLGTGGISLQTYSLFFVKHRQIYGGPCTGEATDLKAVDRLKVCYLDLSNYTSHDLMPHR